MNINETCLDCGKNYLVSRSGIQTTCPHCAPNSNQSSEETLAIKKRLQLILEQEQKQKQEEANFQPPKKESSSPLWKRLTSRLSK